MVMPRSRSSGALSIESNERNLILGLCLLNTLVMAAVRVVLPWSMWPIVPTFTCGLLRSNFSFAIFLASSSQLMKLINVLLSDSLSFKNLFLTTGGGLALHLGHNFLSDGAWRFIIMGKVHGESCAALSAGAHLRGIAEHLRQRNQGLNDL